MAELHQGVASSQRVASHLLSAPRTAKNGNENKSCVNNRGGGMAWRGWRARAAARRNVRSGGNIGGGDQRRRLGVTARHRNTLWRGAPTAWRKPAAAKSGGGENKWRNQQSASAWRPSAHRQREKPKSEKRQSAWRHHPAMWRRQRRENVAKREEA